MSNPMVAVAGRDNGKSAWSFGNVDMLEKRGYTFVVRESTPRTISGGGTWRPAEQEIDEVENIEMQMMVLMPVPAIPEG